MAKKKNFPLRIDPELYAVIERWAQEEFRSVNSHIEFLLRDAARREGRLKKKKGERIKHRSSFPQAKNWLLTSFRSWRPRHPCLKQNTAALKLGECTDAQHIIE